MGDVEARSETGPSSVPRKSSAAEAPRPRVRSLYALARVLPSLGRIEAEAQCRGRRFFGGLHDRVRLGYPRLFHVLPFVLFSSATMYLAGYPVVRLALLLLDVLALETFVHFVLLRPLRDVRDPLRLRAVAAKTGASVGVVVFMMISLALTGGLYSPFAVMLPLPIVGPVLFYGRSRRTARVFLAMMASIVLLGLLPESVRGPRVAAPYDLVLLAGSLVFALWTTAAGLTELTEAALSSNAALDTMREDLLQQSLDRTRALEAVGARVAHDLKNPLAAVKALAQLLGRGASDDRTRQRLDVVEREISTMEEVIREYLSFARPLQDLSLERIELGALVDSALAVMEARAEAGGIHLERSGPEVFLSADPRRLREVFLNLISNALEATSAGGRVSITLRELGTCAEVIVEDSGRGMTKDELSRVGTPYFSTRADGTGLGVVLAKTVVVQHGGTIRYTSELGQGTRVEVSLPLAPEVRPCLPRPAARAEAKAGCRADPDLRRSR